MKKKARIIALYLPQYYPTPINDENWGKGFTEWTNVAKSKPLFKNHYQPHIPADLGFYDLRLEETRIEQAKMAEKYGVEGFCYWHYWFNGKKVLDRPFNEVLKSGKPDFPFCLGWANHSWTNKTWTDVKAFKKDPMILEQTYPGKDDYIAHFYDVLSAFKDKRYITVDGKPLFLVHNVDDIPDRKLLVETWNTLAFENGLKGIFFVGRMSCCAQMKLKNISFKYFNKAKERYDSLLSDGFDAVLSDTARYAEIKEEGTVKKAIRALLRNFFGIGILHIYDYKTIVNNYRIPEEKFEYVFPQIIPCFDRSPRSGKQARIYHGSTPKLFGKMIDNALETVKNKSPEHKVIFLNSWNEWGEGNHMEPDLKWGHGYLNALRKRVIEE